MKVILKKMSIMFLRRLMNAFVIASVESLGNIGNAKIDKDDNDKEAEIIIINGIGMKS